MKTIEFNPNDPQGELVLHQRVVLAGGQLRVDRMIFNRRENASVYVLERAPRKGVRYEEIGRVEFNTGRLFWDAVPVEMMLAIEVFFSASLDKREWLVGPKMMSEVS